MNENNSSVSNLKSIENNEDNNSSKANFDLFPIEEEEEEQEQREKEERQVNTGKEENENTSSSSSSNKKRKHEIISNTQETQENTEMKDEEKQVNNEEGTVKEITEIIQSNSHFIPLYVKMYERKLKKITEERDQLKLQVEERDSLLLIKDDIGNEEESLRIQLYLEKEQSQKIQERDLKLITQYKSQVEILTNLVNDLNKEIKMYQASKAPLSGNSSKVIGNSSQRNEAPHNPIKEVTKRTATTTTTTNQPIKSAIKKPQAPSIPLATNKLAPPSLPKKSEIKNTKVAQASQRNSSSTTTKNYN